MKVVFKNVAPALLTLARECMENLIADFQYQHVNTDQRLQIEGKTLVISGQRCAINGDSLAPLMIALKADGRVPFEYQTSDSRLEWWDTLDSYLTRQGTPAEVLAAWPSGYLSAEKLARLAFNCPVGSPEYRRAAAAGTVPPNEAYELLKLFLKSGYSL